MCWTFFYSKNSLVNPDLQVRKVVNQEIMKQIFSGDSIARLARPDFLVGKVVSSNLTTPTKLKVRHNSVGLFFTQKIV